MIALSLSRDELSAVGQLDLVSYLLAKGWRKSGVFREKADIWSYKNDGEVLVPRSRSYADYTHRIAECLATCAEIEGSHETLVWRDIVSSGHDLVRVRAIDPNYDKGTMPIDEGVALVERTRDILLAAACAAHENRPVFLTRKPTPAIDYMKRVQLGQTEVGSYVVLLHSPVPPALQHSLPGLDGQVDEEPFERSVTRTLVEALSAMKTAAYEAAATREFEPFERSLEFGVSANLCESVIELHKTSRAHAFEVEVGWAAALPPGGRIAEIPSKIRLENDIVDALQTASDVFRKKRPERGIEVAGFVVKLERDDGELLGDITVFGSVGALPGTRKVRIRNLPTDIYDRALEAHRTGVPIRALGELRREGRGYALHGVGDIVIDDDAVEE